MLRPRCDVVLRQRGERSAQEIPGEVILQAGFQPLDQIIVRHVEDLPAKIMYSKTP
jgi:hypothetical protein